MTTHHLDASVERTLREIERRVLGEVWMARSLRLATAIAVAALGLVTIATAVGFATAVPSSLFGLAATVSLAALCRRRFSWCCAAAFVAGLTSVAGFGTYWWLRTGASLAPLWWIILGSVTTMVLTTCWLTVVLAPLDRSHPDMRVN